MFDVFYLQCALLLIENDTEVLPPPIPSITKFTLQHEHSNKYPDLINKNTPTVTIVAAWINMETGVGPSIVSGNQVCNSNCADFPTAPQNKHKSRAVTPGPPLYPLSLPLSRQYSPTSKSY